MTNYTIQEYEEKRLRYFNGQFLEEQDFIDEQKYHVNRQRLHHLLHTWGIADGLTVTADVGATEAVVSPGVAVDGDGRQIVLSSSRTVSLSDHANETVLLVISYHEESSDPASVGGTGDTRWHERPRVEAVTGTVYPPDDTHLRLAKLDVASDGKVSAHHTDVRVSAGVRLGDEVEVRKLTLSRQGVDPSQWPALTCGAAGRADVEGSLQVSGGGAFAGNVGVGTPTPDTLLTLGDGTNQDLLKLNTERGWKLTASGSGGDTTLDLQALASGKSFRVVSQNGNRIPLQVHASDTAEVNAVYLVQDGGNVGVGTTSPGSKLHVAGGRWNVTNTEGDFKIGTAANRLKIGVDTSGGGAGDVRIRAHGGTNRLMLGSGADDVLTIQNNNVGVGVANPTHKLQVEAASTGNEGVLGLSAIALGGGTGTKLGVEAHAYGEGGAHRYGISARAGGAGDGWRFGVSAGAHGDGGGGRCGLQASASGDGGGHRYGLQAEALGSGDGWRYGVQASASGSGTGPKVGVDGGAYGEGSEPRYGVQANAAGAGDGWRFGVLAFAQGDGGGGRCGLRANASGAGDGWRCGIQTSASGGTGPKVGVETGAFGEGDETRYGVQARAGGAGDGWRFGVLADAYGDGGGGRCGLQASASGAGDGWRYGVQASVSGSGTGPKLGVEASAYGEGDETRYGVQANAGGAGDGRRYGVVANAYGDGGGGRFGLQASASGAGDGWRYGLRASVSGNGTGPKLGVDAGAYGEGDEYRCGVRAIAG
ncbi:MAG: hypothetical protein PVF45_14710, partial [Anaerolineae bacterium]